MPVNIEIKAYCRQPRAIARILLELGADHKGTDHQVDTYFKVNEGRLKLREGLIENNLIFYKRNDQAGPKKSDVILVSSDKDGNLKKILQKILGEKVVVDKLRDIYFIDNVKFHIDIVKDLGSFVEIEAIGDHGEEEKLDRQCRHYLDTMHILEADLISESYSDMLLNKTT